MKQYGFRHRILLLAVALVVATQLVMLFPVLDLIKRDSAAQADRTVGLAGALFDEYMHNRAEQLLTTVNVLVSDLPVQASRRERRRRGDDSLGAAQPREPRRRERRGAARLGRNGQVSSTADERPVPAFPSVPFAALEEGTRHRVINIGGVPYQTVTVPLRAPDIRAWVMLGFPIDYALATQLKDLTGLDVSFLSVSGVAPRVLELDAARCRAIERARRPRSEAHRCAARRRSAPLRTFR